MILEHDFMCKLENLQGHDWKTMVGVKDEAFGAF